MRSKVSKRLSRYMFMYPMMLPIKIGRIKFQETYVEAMKFFNEFHKHKEENFRGYRKYVMKCAGFCASAWQHIKKRKKLKFDITSACDQLQEQVKIKLNLTDAKGDWSKYVLFHGCRLPSQLDKIDSQEEKWEIISEVWVEMLCYEASKCKGSYHAQQLRRGGELLTHVWLIGLTDHFQIPHAPARAELIRQ